MMDIFLGILLGIFVLMILVTIHELGHAILARRSGVVVEEFGIGFPPLAWKKKLKNGIVFSLNWLPLGGFVKLQGEHDAANKKGDYGAATFWQKTRILLAGVAANWILAAILFTVLAFTGLPEIIPHQFRVPGDTKLVTQNVTIIGLSKDHPAEQSGLKNGDEIISLDGEKISSSQGLINLIKEKKGQQVGIVYLRDGKENNIKVTLRSDSNGGYLGAELGQSTLLKSTWTSPIVGLATTTQLTVISIQSLGDMLVNLVRGFILQFSPDSNVREKANSDLKAVGDSAAGPVGIMGVLFPAVAKAGFTAILLVSAIISLSLAVMNILPIPALDGGRWFTIVIFRLFKKKLTKEREEKIQTIGFMILMGLVILVTFSDVAKIL